MLAQLQVSELTWALQKQQPKFVLPKHNELLLSAINILKNADAELPLCLA